MEFVPFILFSWLSLCHGEKYLNINNKFSIDKPDINLIPRIMEFTYSEFNCLHIGTDGSSFSNSIVHRVHKMEHWPLLFGWNVKTKHCRGQMFVTVRLHTAEVLLRSSWRAYENRLLIIVAAQDQNTIYFNDFTNKVDQILGPSEGLLVFLGTNFTYHIRRQPSLVMESLEELKGVWNREEGGVTNFQGRQIKIGASNCSFFSEIAPIGRHELMDWTGGFDYELFTDIFQRLNLTYELVPPPTGKILGLLEEADANGGLIRLAASGSIDVISCGLTITSFTNSILDITFPMIEVCYKLVVPRPQLRTPFWNVFWAFQPYVWAILVSTIFAGAFGLKYAALLALDSSSCLNYERCWMEIFSMLLGSGTNLGRKKGLRMLIMWLMILNVVLSSGYSSLTIGFLMRNFRDKKIETISDLIENDFRWISSYRVAVNRILDPETEPKTEDWAKRQVVIPPNEMTKLLSTRKYVVLGTELQIQRMFLETGGPNEELVGYEAASNCLSRCFLTVGFAKGSPFKQPILKYIGRNNNGGLNKKRIDKILYNLSLSKQYVRGLFETGERSLKNTPEKLAFSRVKGAFLVWAIGMTGAIVVFIIEKKTQQKVASNK